MDTDARVVDIEVAGPVDDEADDAADVDELRVVLVVPSDPAYSEVLVVDVDPVWGGSLIEPTDDDDVAVSARGVVGVPVGPVVLLLVSVSQ